MAAVARRRPKSLPCLQFLDGWPGLSRFVLVSDSHAKGGPLLARRSRGVEFENVRNSAFDFILGET